MEGSEIDFIEQIYTDRNDYDGIVFLDKDGTLIGDDENYIRDVSQIKPLERAVEAIKLLNQKNIAVIITTNQPAVARGLITIPELMKLNDKMVEVFAKEKARIDAIFSCPHHPERNHPDISENALKYRIICECRKPGLAMFERAMEYFEIKNVLGVVGDQTKDALVGKKLGTLAIIVKTGYGGKDGKHKVVADFIAENLEDAVNKVLQR